VARRAVPVQGHRERRRGARGKTQVAGHRRHRRDRLRHERDEGRRRRRGDRPAEPFTFRQRHRIVEAATSNGLGTIYPFPAAAADGATIAFGPDYVHMYRRVGVYVDRIIKGAKPAQLPVQQPTKFDLIVNLTAARAVKLPIPQPLLQRADQIIQ
jgi:ABC transporter substrate binding protein